MSKKRYYLLGVLAILTLLGGCGGSSVQSGRSSNVSSSSAEVTEHIGTEQIGHQPGAQNVSTLEKAKEFDATPNFYFFTSCGRSCYLPLYPTPQLEVGTAVTSGWPCEFFDAASKVRGPFCTEHTSSEGDRVHVICQLIGNDTLGQGTIQNDKFERSNVWDKVIVPWSKATKSHEKLAPTPDGSGFYGYGADIWLGNTGWHDLPCK